MSRETNPRQGIVAFSNSRIHGHQNQLPSLFHMIIPYNSIIPHTRSHKASGFSSHPGAVDVIGAPQTRGQTSNLAPVGIRRRLTKSLARRAATQSRTNPQDPHRARLGPDTNDDGVVSRGTMESDERTRGPCVEGIVIGKRVRGPSVCI